MLRYQSQLVQQTIKHAGVKFISYTQTLSCRCIDYLIICNFYAAGIMIRKLFALVLFLAICLELNQGSPASQAKEMEEYAEALIQGECCDIKIHCAGKRG